MRIQIDRQEAENRKQRKSDLRRDVYLQLCDALPRTNVLFASLGHILITDSRAQEVVNELGSIAAKIQLIAEPRTSELATKLSNAYGIFWIEAVKKSFHIQSAILESDNQQRYLNDLGAKLRQKLEVYDEAPEFGKQKAKTELEAWRKEHEYRKAQLEAIVARRSQLRKDYLEWMLDRFDFPQNIAIELAAEIRKELENVTNTDALIEAMRTSKDSIRETMRANL